MDYHQLGILVMRVQAALGPWLRIMGSAAVCDPNPGHSAFDADDVPSSAFTPLIYYHMHISPTTTYLRFV
jgi:hypothetical protein